MQNTMRTFGLPPLMLLLPCLAFAQSAPQPTPAPRSKVDSAVTVPAVTRDFIRANYTKFEYRIPMRDRVKLFTSVYIPKDVFTDSRKYPIMMERTPYNVAPYGIEEYRDKLGPSESFAREKFIFVYQDVRGRFMSEGKYVLIRPRNTAAKTSPAWGSKEIDETTDTWDTIDWLVKNVPGNTGKVGMWGISQPGFYATAGMIDAHPALVAVSPQAPVTDYYLGDDVYHNGVFMLAHRFAFYMAFHDREGDPSTPPVALPFQYGTVNGYDFYLQMGSLANADEKYFKHRQPLWNLNVDHPTYDEVWQSRSIWKYLDNIKPAVMLVGGWYDHEDPQGLFRQYYFMEKHSPPKVEMLVVGPWNHGGFSRGDGDRLGKVNFGSKTALYYRENIEFPFFLSELKGVPQKLPKAYVFNTGLNEWRKFDTWPPAEAKTASIYLDAHSKLAWQQPSAAAFDEYLSDPMKPVPYVDSINKGVLNSYMTEDQRFAATRPDVLVYQTDVLDHDVSIFGPINVDLKVSTSGTDSDFDVKVIDVYPNDTPNYNLPAPPPPEDNDDQVILPILSPMGGYEELIRGEPFRGKYRKSFEKPVPFEPGQPDRIAFALPDVAHTFRTGHRIMIQIQSSWFPLTDRNPQKFMDIGKAVNADFVKATERVYFGGADGSRITFKMGQ
ncbi:MAG TPA: CocE/NonD family hydrolase [Bryobacteraceae bacterium]|nr:CocE/NonD family hydrolase [Bryobacteraceae bacterium]